MRMHTLNITNGAAVLLFHMLGADKWAKTAQEIYHAGAMMDILEKVKDSMPDERKDSDEHEAWVAAPADPIEVRESVRDTCKKCVKHVIGQGLVRPSPITVTPLLTSLGLVDEDEDDEKE